MLLVRSQSRPPDKAGSQQVEASPTVHLALDRLQPRVLPLCLAIRPWFDQCCLHRAVVPSYAGSERSHQTVPRTKPFIKPFRLPVLDQTVEAVEQISRRRQIWHGRSDYRDRPRSRLRHRVALGCHHAGNAAGRRCLAGSLIPRGGSFISPLPGRPFRDDTQAASETLGFHGPPQRSTVTATTGPYGLKLRHKRIE